MEKYKRHDMQSATVEVEVVVRFRNGDTGKLVGKAGRARSTVEMDASWPGDLNRGAADRQTLADMIISHSKWPVCTFADPSEPLHADDFEPVHNRWILANWITGFGVTWDVAWRNIDRGIFEGAQRVIRKARAQRKGSS